MIIGLLCTVLGSIHHVHCQESEDLNNQQLGRRLTNSGGNQQLNLVGQQQFVNNRRFNAPPVSPQVAPSMNPIQQAQQPPSAPILTASGQQQATSGATNSQRPSTSPQSPFQRTNFANRFTSFSNSASSSNPQAASSQQQPTILAPQGVPPTGNNVEQIMKSAISRATKLEAEPRQDTLGVSSNPATLQTSADSLQSRQGAQFQSQQQSQSTSKPAVQSTSKQSEATDAESSPSQTASSTGSDGNESGLDGQTTTKSHETVYSDQRFANLFARRKTLNKTKFTPMETTRAKPTLPSFIKSPPDPKQFTASENTEGAAISSRQNVPASSASLIASRPSGIVGRPNLAQQQPKKSAPSASPIASANIKKQNQPTNGKQVSNPSQKASLKDAKSPPPSAPASKPISNNPFSRQNNSNDPANVIAMARKRLLANNALESGKLKQQQQQLKQSSTTK